MTSSELRKKFLEFFEKNGHKIVPSSSLIPDDPSVLLTTAGMQQFKKYYTGELDFQKDYPGKIGATSVQKSFRTSDIDEVGDESHLTFFEMLGNFSFGGYFKKEAIRYAHGFLKEINLPIEYVTVFEGDADVPADEESADIWRGIGITDIRRMGREDNFWGPTGAEGPCGPTTEIYAGGIEIWNLVFNQYYCKPDKTLVPLQTSGVDTGMGLERLAMVKQGKRHIFETDLFFGSFHLFLTAGHEQEARIIADHLRAAIFLLSDGVRPSNKERGYILRRLIRRAIVQSQRFGFSQNALPDSIKRVIEYYGAFYDELRINKEIIRHEFIAETERFTKTLQKGIKEFFDKFPDMKVQEGAPDRHYTFHHIKRISGDDAFYFHQTYGLTLDTIKDLAKSGGHAVEVNEQEFERALEKHREISRAGAEKKFGGHGLLLDTGELKAANEEELKKVTRLHTATHLLQAALRRVLGSDVRQMGSDITAGRTRFDFSFPRKLTPEEVKKAEDTVNGAVADALPVQCKEMDIEEAKKTGALYFFKERYPPRVKIYQMGEGDKPFSREFCGGPHVTNTREIGKFVILKEEAVAGGVRRIRATVEP